MQPYKDYATMAYADNTLRNYNTDWRDFLNYCQSTGTNIDSVTDVDVANFLVARATKLRVSTLRMRLTGIKHHMAVRGIKCDLHSKAITDTLSGLARHFGTAPEQKGAITIPLLKSMVDHIDGSREKIARDRAMILIAFAGAFRRSEVCHLKRYQIKFHERGAEIFLPKSKTDQEGSGRHVGIPYKKSDYCAATALKRWLDVRDFDLDDYIFPSLDSNRNFTRKPISLSYFPRIVKNLIKKHCISMGFEPAEAEKVAQEYSGHSFRAGFVTAAAEAGAPEWQIAMQTGHKSLDTLKRYMRSRCVFAHNALEKIGL